MTWDPFKDENATLIEDPERWDPFRDEGAKAESPSLLEYSQPAIERSIGLSINQEQLDQVSVADWMERHHAIPFDYALDNYEATAKNLGLSGKPAEDIAELKKRRELSQFATRRLPKHSERIEKAQALLGGKMTGDGVFVAQEQPEHIKPRQGDGISRRERMMQSADALRSLSGGAPTDEEMQEMKTAFKLLESDAQAKELERIAREAGSVKGFWEAISENKQDLIPVPLAGSIDEIQEATSLLDLVERYRTGDTSNAEELELYRILADQNRERTIGGYVGEMISMMPQFMADIASGAGLFGAGRKGTQKVIEKALKRETLEALEKRLLGKGLLAAPGILAGTTASLPVSGAGMTIQKYQEAMLPDLELRGDSLENFRLLVGDAPEATDAAKEAITSTYIELLTERTGGALTGLAKPFKDQLVKTALGRYVLRYNPSIRSEQLKQVVDQVGFNGILGEMFEERVGDLARYATGLDEELHLPDANQLAAELISFSIPAGAFYATDRFLAVDRFVAPENGVTPSVWNGLEQNFSDVEVLTYGVERFDDPRLAGVMIRAKHGDSEAQEAYRQATSDGSGTGQADSQESPFLQALRRRESRLREELSADPESIAEEATTETDERPEFYKQKSRSSFIGRVLTPASGRLRRIHPALAGQLRRMEFGMQRQNVADTGKVLPFLKTLRSIRRKSREDYAALDLALKNQNEEAARAILEKHSGTEAFDQLRDTLDGAFKRAREADIPVDYRHTYYPRMIRDLDGLMGYLGKSNPELQSSIEERIKQSELERLDAGKGPLTEADKTAIINSELSRFYELRRKRPQNAEEREIETIDSEMNQFYARPEDALLNYLSTLNEGIAFRDFFGKHKVLEDDSKALNIEKSIGLYLNDLLSQGLIEYSDVAELHDPGNKGGILDARFGFRSTRGPARVIRELGYLTTMGQVSSAITQLTDQAFSIWYSGLKHHAKNAGKALLAMNEIKVKELGVDRIGEEFRTSRGLASWLDRVFTVTGLKAFDRFGKSSLVNAAIDNWREKAGKDALSANDLNELRWMFGAEAESVIDDLREGRRTVNTDFLAYNILSDFQPVSLSEMPTAYLENPNARILYMLRTFTIKQLETYRREVINKTKLSLQRGEYLKAAGHLANGARLLTLLWLTGMAADSIKDFIYFGDDPDWDDLMWDNLWKLFGLSRYHIYVAREKSIVEAGLKLTALPAPYLEYPVTDLIKAIKQLQKGREVAWDEFDSWRMVPFFGKFVWSRSDRMQERRRRRKQD